jgi:hypothetical protein
MDRFFLTTYVLLIGFILSCVIIDLLNDQTKERRVFIAMFILVLTGTSHALITLWG